MGRANKKENGAKDGRGCLLTRSHESTNGKSYKREGKSYKREELHPIEKRSDTEQEKRREPRGSLFLKT
jgi:hypothetical protein